MTRALPRRRRGGDRARWRAITRVLGRRQPSREDLERGGGVRVELARVGVSLAGSLALRYLITQEGRRSARVADDTWKFTAKPEQMHPVALRRGEQLAAEARRLPARLRPRRMHGTTVGRITVVQEDRIRVVDARGRGYLLTVKKRRASLGQLERWRDERTPVRVRYRGVPDAGAIAERIRPARATGDERS